MKHKFWTVHSRVRVLFDYGKEELMSCCSVINHRSWNVLWILNWNKSSQHAVSCDLVTWRCKWLQHNVGSANQCELYTSESLHNFPDLGVMWGQAPKSGFHSKAEDTDEPLYETKNPIIKSINCDLWRLCCIGMATDGQNAFLCRPRNYQGILGIKTMIKNTPSN
jgi:hypothetical protein